MFEKEAFIEACVMALKESHPQVAMKDLVGKAIAEPAALDKALGEPVKGGIETIHRSSELTILQVVWAPYMTIYPHNHQTWAVIGVYGGQEDNTFYRRRAAGVGLDRVNDRSLEEADDMVLGDQVIHAVHNPRRGFTGAIHVYGGDFFSIPRSEWASAEAPEQPYSVERARQTFEDANRRAEELFRT
jgi:predicted metal-dependent enzyme (double-stranded beta helix superfamily)